MPRRPSPRPDPATATLPLPAVPAGARRLVLAYSGGLDSTVLLHALAEAAALPLRAVHVHHGLQPAADDWAAHCAAVCAEWDVPFECRRVSVDPRDGSGPEAAARAARYAALRAALTPGDLLVTAHHRDDQAETVLLRLLRGSGIEGLAAMRPLQPFEPGRLWRPLLELPHAHLRAYAEARALRWIEDPHNAELRYTRSWLRGAVLPLLRERLPGAERALVRAARLAGEATELHAALASIDAAALARGAALSVAGLRRLSPARRHNLLRHWLRGTGRPLPDEAMLHRICAEVLEAAVDAEPCLAWPGTELRRYRDHLYAMTPLAPPPADWSQRWGSGTRLELPPGCGWLEAPAPPPWPLTVRAVRPGERLRERQGAPARALRNRFQEAGVPPWLRTRLPVLVCDGVAVWIPGVFLQAEWRAALYATAWRPTWHHRLPGLAPALTPEAPFVGGPGLP